MKRIRALIIYLHGWAPLMRNFMRGCCTLSLFLSLFLSIYHDDIKARVSMYLDTERIFLRSK